MKNISIISALLFIIIFGCGDNKNNYIEESGTIETTDIIISSQTAGKILSIRKDEGSLVKVGDTILTIDKELYEIQLKQSQAAEKLAEAQLNLLKNGARKEDRNQAVELFNQAEANFTSAANDKERFSVLFQSNSISEKQWEDVQTRFKIAEAQYKSAKENLNKVNNIARPEELQQAAANLERAKSATELINKNLRDCIVTSPINGIVTKTFFEENETVVPMSSLVKISDLSLVEMNVYVNETDLGRIKPNMPAEVTIDSFPDKVFKGKVIYISPEAEFTPKTIQTKDERTKLVYKVKLQIQNQNNELKSGMPADAKIILN